MRVHTINVLAILTAAIMLASGCDAQKPQDAPPAEDQDSDSPEVALGHLKTVLDSWVLGDDTNTINADHPELFFSGNLLGQKLMRYEIGPIRTLVQSNKRRSYEVAVTLVFQSTAGKEIMNTTTLTIIPPGNAEATSDSGAKWLILGA